MVTNTTQRMFVLLLTVFSYYFIFPTKHEFVDFISALISDIERFQWKSPRQTFSHDRIIQNFDVQMFENEFGFENKKIIFSQRRILYMKCSMNIFYDLLSVII